MTTSWQVGQWTDSELRHAVEEHRATLKDLAEDSPARADIRQGLDGLLVEQEARRRLRHPRSLRTGLSA
jgi:hypothetical protein